MGDAAESFDPGDVFVNVNLADIGYAEQHEQDGDDEWADGEAVRHEYVEPIIADEKIEYVGRENRWCDGQGSHKAGGAEIDRPPGRERGPGSVGG